MQQTLSHAAEVAASNAQVVARVLGRDVTRGELSTAFDRIADRSNWKNPIDRVLDLNDAELFAIIEAVRFFAGCVPTFTIVPGGKLPKCRYRVRAVGYYAAVGA